MSRPPEFALVPTSQLREHEQVVLPEVDRMVERLSKSQVLREPILVSRDGNVILNGHHRYAALRAMGAERIPVWIVDYEDESIELDRWKPGPPITKAGVLEAARAGRLFPPKTTRHRVKIELPLRPTPMSELMPARPSTRSPDAATPPLSTHRPK